MRRNIIVRKDIIKVIREKNDRKVKEEENYCYIELFYLQDKKGNYVITEVFLTKE